MTENQNLQPAKTSQRNDQQCIACGRKCAMSGLCLMPWPEFAKLRRDDATKAPAAARK